MAKYQLNHSSVKLGDERRKGIWKGLRSEYGTSFSPLDERPADIPDNDGLLRTIDGQDGVYLAIGSSKRYILDVLREKIQGRLHGVTETRRFFAQLLGASESFDVARVGAPEIRRFLVHHNLKLDEEGMTQLLALLPTDRWGTVAVMDLLEAIDPQNFPKEPPLEPFMAREDWARWATIKYGQKRGY